MANCTYYSRVMMVPLFSKNRDHWSYTQDIAQLAFRLHLADGLEESDLQYDYKEHMRTSLVTQCGIFTRHVLINHRTRAQRGIVYHHEIRATKLPDFEGWDYGIRLQCGTHFAVLIPGLDFNTDLLRFLAEVCPVRGWDAERGIKSRRE